MVLKDIQRIYKVVIIPTVLRHYIHQLVSLISPWGETLRGITLCMAGNTFLIVHVTLISYDTDEASRYVLSKNLMKTIVYTKVLVWLTCPGWYFSIQPFFYNSQNWSTTPQEEFDTVSYFWARLGGSTNARAVPLSPSKLWCTHPMLLFSIRNTQACF